MLALQLLSGILTDGAEMHATMNNERGKISKC